ncbi:hypothetical protein MesoLjLa_58590 [Mesorhizobium sp. L-2-11]|nr:hypothetical protein MesoLjLa_58590 [Mesorhizobium sp. L-2-11]
MIASSDKSFSTTAPAALALSFGNGKQPVRTALEFGEKINGAQRSARLRGLQTFGPALRFGTRC